MHLSETYLHPVKSCASLACERIEIEERGPRHDRRWMVVDPEGRFLTARNTPRMVLIRARPEGEGLLLEAPAMPQLRVRAPDGDAARTTVRVWRDEVDAVCAGADGDPWLSRFLGTPVRLVHMDARARRGIDPDYAQSGEVVSFADGFPLLLIGQSSLDALNARLVQPLPMTRFRPNLVVEGAAPHAEDHWRRIRIGAIDFDVVKPCKRCVLTTVDPETGTFDASGEPLATLKRYRRGPRGIAFGVNLIPRGCGTLQVGDALAVIVRELGR